MEQEQKPWTMAELKEANKAAGWHFFSADTMRFFRSRIGEKVYQGPGGVYFVTSEQFNEQAPRLYSVRQARDGKVDTTGKFQQYGTPQAAARAAVALAAGKAKAATVKQEPKA